jgi:hypothetical protein
MGVETCLVHFFDSKSNSPVCGASRHAWGGYPGYVNCPACRRMLNARVDAFAAVCLAVQRRHLPPGLTARFPVDDRGCAILIGLTDAVTALGVTLGSN